MKTRIYAVLAALVLFAGLIVGLASTATAHDATFAGDCEYGVTLNAINYDGNQANQWSLTVNGSTTSGTFGGSTTQNVPVAQDGTTTYTWSGHVQAADGSFSYSNGGTFGPCGDVPPTEEPTPTPTPEPPTETPTPEPPTETPTVPVTPPTETPEPPVTPPTEEPPVTPETPSTPPVEITTDHVYTCTSHTVIKYENGVEVSRDTNTFASTCDKGSTTPNPSEEGL